jgi:uncharacterized protein
VGYVGTDSGLDGRDASDMDQRLSLITLGVADVDRARRFYEGLGWSGESPDGEVVFFQVGGTILDLWGRDKLAEDSLVENAGGWGGGHPRLLRWLPGDGGRPFGRGRGCGRDNRSIGGADRLGWLFGIFIDPDGHPWEVAHNPGWMLKGDGSVRLH